MHRVSSFLSHWWLVVPIWFCLVTPSQAKPPHVVVSIKPIHSLVHGVMQGVAEPVLLMTGAQSPHTFNLRPSDTRHLAAADLIVLVSKGFETFLVNILDSLSSHTRTLELMQQQGIINLPIRSGGLWESGRHHPHYELEHSQHESFSQQQQRDPHIWLSPHNALVIIDLVQQALIALDPPNTNNYQRNADMMKSKIEQMDQVLLKRLAGIQKVPFIVFHDAYQYFEHHYRLNAIGSITLSPERLPGAKRIHEIHSQLAQQRVRCIFSEPQFEPKLLRTIAQGNSVRTGILDPLGGDLPVGSEAYFTLMQNLTDNLLQCLEAES
jgi:zinc transport system substrate-binding protein